MNEWLIRALVLLSFAAHVVLVLFAEIRRRKAFSGRRFFLWLAYLGGRWAANFALGHLSVSSTSQEQKLIGFWLPFLLLHLGGPDNISAYSFEDNILSKRKAIEAVLQVGGALIVLYKYVRFGGSGTSLICATMIMFAVGFVKALALRKADMGSIRSSGKKQKPISFRTDQRGVWEPDDEKALLVAHDLFHISKGAFADYAVDKDTLTRDTRAKLFSLEWRDMCKVVEMELSLMYDILYTKAAVIHTWHGYIIRVLSPPFTAAAFLLFFFYSKDDYMRVDVVITYILLAATFLLDMRWLLRALGSTWTYAFLDARSGCWLRCAFLCTGRWRRLRRVVVSMDLGRLLLLRAPSSSYRLWSGTIGQYNLFHECTRDTTSLCSRLVKVVARDCWKEYEYHYSRGLDISADEVRKLLFQTIWESLKKAYPVVEEEGYSGVYSPPLSLGCGGPATCGAPRCGCAYGKGTYGPPPSWGCGGPATCGAPRCGCACGGGAYGPPPSWGCEGPATCGGPRCGCACGGGAYGPPLSWGYGGPATCGASAHGWACGGCAHGPPLSCGCGGPIMCRTPSHGWASGGVAHGPPPPDFTGHRQLDEALNFGPEFQEVILIWHIATDVFLLCNDQNAASSTDVKAIKALSDYMVFLVSARPYMLPGHKLQSLHKATRDALDKIWSKKGSSSSSRISPCSTTREKELASILRKMEKDRSDPNMEDRSDLYKKSIILSDGTKYAEVLLTLLSPLKYAEMPRTHWFWHENPVDKPEERKRKERLRKIILELIPALSFDGDGIPALVDEDAKKLERNMKALLEHILKAWVRLLIFISVRCSGDSHAKQLGRGGELTTIVWILAEHASIFGIDK